MKIKIWLAKFFAGKFIPAKIMAKLIALGLVGATVGGTAVCAVAYKESTPPPKHESSYVPPPKPAPEVCEVPKPAYCPPVIHNVPDGGSTLALMGMGIATVGGLGWRFRRS